jgi:hypothetical protein
MFRRLLAGLVLGFMAAATQANPPPASHTPAVSPAPETTANTPRESGESTAGKPAPPAQSAKTDEPKLNKLKVYPCF